MQMARNGNVKEGNTVREEGKRKIWGCRMRGATNSQPICRLDRLAAAILSMGQVRQGPAKLTPCTTLFHSSQASTARATAHRCADKSKRLKSHSTAATRAHSAARMPSSARPWASGSARLATRSLPVVHGQSARRLPQPFAGG